MRLIDSILRGGRRVLRWYYTLRVRRRAASCGPGLKVNGPSLVTSRTHLGRNVNFNGLEITGSGKVTIGDNFHSGPGVLLIPQNHNYDRGEAIPYDSTYLPLDIAIGDNVWLGSRVIVLGGVTIGEGAIVQAGSCVVSDIPRCAIAGGHPAVVFKHRDVEHYERLKKEGRFH
jgi:acetyltransferase-like isoleucine patch superfamily enzyme